MHCHRNSNRARRSPNFRLHFVCRNGNTIHPRGDLIGTNDCEFHAQSCNICHWHTFSKHAKYNPAL